MTDREALLDELRPVAFAIAYRMLGSVSGAEDVVQEALLRVHQALQAGEQIASPRAFVATVTTRLAINELRSARARRERYVGEWLPEPIITGGHDDPALHAETADSLSLAMLVLLENLSPEQRAVLLLHDVFSYGYPEIAGIVGKSEDNVRQLATRARRHVEQRRPRFQTTREQHDELARRFFAAAEQGDLAGLEALLAHDVELTGDGGKVDRRVGARYRRRSDHKHQRDRQPRQADAPRASRRLQIATAVCEMTGSANSPTRTSFREALTLVARFPRMKDTGSSVNSARSRSYAVGAALVGPGAIGPGLSVYGRVSENPAYRKLSFR